MKDLEITKYLKTVLILAVFFFGGSNAKACDVCGCGLGGYYFGVLPNGQLHFVGLRYQTAYFNALIDNRLFEDEYSDDTFRRAELIGGFSLTKKLMLTFNIPYSINTMEGNLQNIKSNGFGDPSLLLYLKPLKPASSTQNWVHTLMVGIGAKFPLGEYDKTDNESIINRNFQLGSGSLDYIMAYNYTLSYRTHALNLEGSFKLNTENNLGYQFGNQFSTSLNYYWSIPAGVWVFIPFAGSTFEYSEKHTDLEILQNNTGGNVILGNVGFQVFMRRFVLTSQYQIPIIQKYNTDEISSIEGNNRFSIGLNYNFMSK